MTVSVSVAVFKNAVAQLLNADSALDLQVSADQITTVDINTISAELIELRAAGKSYTDVSYEVKVTGSITPQKILQVESTLDTAADTTSLSNAITSQCNGNCECSGSSVVTKANSVTQTVQQSSAHKGHAANLQTLVYALIVAFMLGVKC